MKYLLTLSIGPVQDFIASARRTRDLWFGSWLLSEISKAAAKKIRDDKGVLIFPSPPHLEKDLQPDSDFSVVNKLLAQIETSNISRFCDDIYSVMSMRLGVIKDDAFKELKGLVIHRTNANVQIFDLIEFYWAAQPLDGTSYELVRKKTEALLAARKATRNFKQVTWGLNVPKSSIDGLRESVIDESVFDRLDDNQLTDGHKYGVRGKERLCGVGLLKRHGKPIKNAQGVDSFFSTSHVAALPLLNRLKDKGVVEEYLNELKRILGIGDSEIKAYLGHVPQGATLKTHRFFCNNDGSLLYDGHLLFKERLCEFFLDENTRKEAEKALKSFLTKAFGEEKYPHPYYAILHADGDRMGAAIDEQAKKGYQEHQKLSQALSKFAGKVKEIVERGHEGSCIYSGGDDVLALLPLHTALQCARVLADEFQDVLRDFKDEDRKTPTLSVGIAVGHHLDPLQETLRLAREAEKVAKKEVPNKQAPEKNALAIILSKRGGADRTVKGSWDKGKSEGALDYRLNRFVFLFLKDELPDGAAYELHDLALRLKLSNGATNEQKDILLDAQRAEAKRILKRKKPKHGEKKTIADDVYKYLHGLIDSPALSLEELSNEIIVAREFKEAFEQAGIDAEKFAADNGIMTKKESIDDHSEGAKK
ncbi:MAG: type III-B CRISPR-associated protein Cas10/Cmr2 [bacterium]